MALQSNGITVFEINNVTRRITFFAGSVEIRFAYRPRLERFTEMGRGYIDRHRAAGRISIPDHQYRAMMRQAHAIAREHGWKQ